MSNYFLKNSAHGVEPLSRHKITLYLSIDGNFRLQLKRKPRIGDDDEFFDDEDPSEDGDDRFFNPALLSHIAVRLKDKVPRGTHVKGSIPYERAFTGKDIVVRISSSLVLYVG